MYYNENTIVFYNGSFIKASEARGNVYDQTLHYGYGVFEGIRSYATESGVQIFKGKEHFERIARHLAATALQVSGWIVCKNRNTLSLARRTAQAIPLP